MKDPVHFFKARSEAKAKRKQIEHAVFEVKYARRMREDQLDPKTLQEMHDLQADLKRCLKDKAWDEGMSLSEKAMRKARKLHPAPGKHYGVRENVEVFVVVMAVALAFRTYFFQPYQIPTGSMQPTLYGLTARVDYEPTWVDKPPFRWAKFILTGTRYIEVRAKENGLMPHWMSWAGTDTFRIIRLSPNGKPHKIHQDLLYAELPIPSIGDPGIVRESIPAHREPVQKGQLLASGLLKQGDHIIVNRFITNFRQPRRGEIVVFSTMGLNLARENSAYIKRLTGLPGEKISICQGKLLVNGEVVDSPWVFERIYEDERYEGYANLGGFETCQHSLTLGGDEFLMMGDNTYHSSDGRMFGGVPGENIMGIGVFVPWPVVNRGIYDDRAGWVD